MIHSTAIIDPKANIAPSVKIGPYCVIGPDVTLDEEVELVSQVTLSGKTTIGARTKIFPFASIGQPPQDIRFSGENSFLEIGTDNQIREYVTINTGAHSQNALTKIGNHCFLMVGTHIAHDCRLGNHVIMANNATLAGHVIVEDYVMIGGLAAVHQFVRIGSYAMIGGMSGVEHDVIPYALVKGDRARLSGLNLVGLKRRGSSSSDIHSLMDLYSTLFQENSTESSTLEYRIFLAKERFQQIPIANNVLSFIQTQSKHHICTPKI